MFADLIGETLGVKMRAGNAGAKDAGDHVELLDAALRQLPERITKGHHGNPVPLLRG